jgi:hypothetical protein
LCSKAERAGDKSTKDGLFHSYEVTVESHQPFDLQMLDRIFMFFALAAIFSSEAGCASDMHK